MTETRNQQRIREILQDKEEEQDHSLRGQALERATGRQVPRTLTPWEWQQWYEQHGQPVEHRREASEPLPWWRRMLPW